MKIAVLGLGPSLKEFNKGEFDLSIGVNDIWKVIQTDILVCLNNESEFTPDRLKIINESKPKIFYSQIVNWDKRLDFKKINFIPGYPDNFCQLETNQLHKSYCSPFVACEIAYKFHGAKEIHLFGVDMVNHPHLNKEICDKIVIHFYNLKEALREKDCKLIIHGEGILKDI